MEGQQRKKRRSTFFLPGRRGRATGLQSKNVKKDEDGLADVNDYWASDSDDGITAKPAAAVESPEEEEEEEEEAEEVQQPVAKSSASRSHRGRSGPFDFGAGHEGADEEEGAAAAAASAPAVSSTPTVATPRKRLSFTPDVGGAQTPITRSSRRSTQIVPESPLAPPSSQGSKRASRASAAFRFEAEPPPQEQDEDEAAAAEMERGEPAAVEDEEHKRGRKGSKKGRKDQSADHAKAGKQTKEREAREEQGQQEEHHSPEEEGTEVGAAAKKAARGKGRGKRGPLAELGDAIPDPEDGSREKRHRIAPVDYWKNEKPIYQPSRRKSTYGLPELKGVQPGAPTPVPKPHGARAVKRKPKTEQPSPTATATPKSARPKPSEDVVPQMFAASIAPHVPVLDWTTDGEPNATTEVALARSGVDLKFETPAPGLRICKTFSLRAARWSSGIVQLDPGAKKETQRTQGNFLVFYVASGKLEAAVHQSVLTLGTGCTFFVPPQNTYSLHNVGKSVCQLSYTQVKLPE